MIELNQNIVGKKLDRFGNWRTYPGNTVASFLVTNTPVIKEVNHFRDSLRNVKEISEGFVFTSLNSLHVTIFDLISDQDRNPKDWPVNLDINCSLEDSDNYFNHAFNSIVPPDEIVMRPTGVICSNVLMITLSPKNLNSKLALEKYRAQLFSMTGITPINESDYTFHITLAYQYLKKSELELEKLERVAISLFKERNLYEGEILLMPPSLLLFTNMNHFGTSR